MELHQLRHRLKETIRRSNISAEEVESFVSNIIFSSGQDEVIFKVKKNLHLPFTKQKLTIVLISEDDEEHITTYVSNGVLTL